MKKVPHTMIERFFLTIALVSFPLTLMAQVAGGEVKRLRPSKPVKEVIITNDTKKQENSKKVNVSQKTKGLISCPDTNHPHWIDLGLPSGTQWRCCNEGASTPEAYGGYYTFGQVSSAPTMEQCKELVSRCKCNWKTQNGVNGRKFTGPNGGTIFLPAAGLYWNGELILVGSLGYYWSSTPDGEDGAYGLNFNSGYVNYINWTNRDNGRSVRPVRK